MIGKNKIIMELNNEVKELKEKNRELESEILSLKRRDEATPANLAETIGHIVMDNLFIYNGFYSSKKSKEKSKPIINIKSIYGIPYDEDGEEYNGLKGMIYGVRIDICGKAVFVPTYTIDDGGAQKLYI